MNIWLIAHAFIVDQQGRVLIIRRSKNNDVLPSVWDIPGGSCEPGEDPLAAAIRETREEAGIDIDSLSLFAHTSNIDTDKDTQFVRFIFSATYRGGTIRLNPREHEAYAWINPIVPDQEPLVDYLPHVIQLWLKKKHVQA